jgi:DNA (cytosine-5)-methyltransferase 1
MMKYLSVCSGIEAATAAWHPLGWEPLAFSEIEAFPRKVLAHHYPDVPLHGDFTILRNQYWIKDADVLVGGTPCQAFSVAGLRNSLDDDRGNLTLEFVRLADAIDDLRRTGTIIVWENVPGVLSVKDNAFGCFLAALVGNDTPLKPTGGQWTNAGMVVGPKRRAAWRVLDAQYFGVAQRRRRVFVVASSRDGFDPAEVLFEREGLRRNTSPSREAGQEPSATIAARFGISRNNHEEVVAQYTEEVADTLSVGANQTIGRQSPSVVAHVTGPITAGIYKGMRGTEGIDSNWAVVQPIAFGVGENPDLGHCLRSGASKADKHESTTYVAQPIAFSSKDYGNDATTNLSPTLRAMPHSGSHANGGGQMAVTYSIMPMNSGKDYKAREVDVAQPIMASGPVGGNQGGDYILQPIAIHPHVVGRSANAGPQGKEYLTDGFAYTMDSRGVSQAVMQQMAVAQPMTTSFYANEGSHGMGDNTEVSVTLKAHPKTSNLAAVSTGMAVRRLTPRECERLQGFPDDYTAIPNAADGPRYKALGNSMAVPVMAWIGKRINENVKTVPTDSA